MNPTSPPHAADLLTVVGARPQFIKSAALTRALPDVGWSQRLVHSGQHPDDAMGLDFLIELGVPAPDVQLRPNQASRSRRMADMLVGIEAEIRKATPRAVVVYGDTDSTLAGALAAHHCNVPLVHVEAGLRSGDRRMPEEHNRIMTDQLADWLFTTGPAATRQLINEGMREERIAEVGDVMLDVALAARPLLRDRHPLLWPADGPVMLVTLHRPGLVDQSDLLKGALGAMGAWVSKVGGRIYFPVHPRTRRAMEEAGLKLPEGVVDPGPIGYLDMQAALHRADLVLTDSGGVQKEAWYQGTPAVVLRSTTEWKELLEMGACCLVDPSNLATPAGRNELLDKLETWRTVQVPSVQEAGLFGGGAAAASLLRTLTQRDLRP